MGANITTKVCEEILATSVTVPRPLIIWLLWGCFLGVCLLNSSLPSDKPSALPTTRKSNPVLSFKAPVLTSFPSASWHSLAISSDGHYQTATTSTAGYIYRSTDKGATFSLVGFSSLWGAVAMSMTGQYQTAAYQYCTPWLYGCNAGGSRALRFEVAVTHAHHVFITDSIDPHVFLPQLVRKTVA
jgi:hypothetical protein